MLGVAIVAEELVLYAELLLAKELLRSLKKVSK